MRVCKATSNYVHFRSVGRGGQSDHSDVKTIQILLNLCGNAIGLATPLVEDGVVGAHTLDALEQCQRKVLGLPDPEGRVDPDSATILRLGCVACAR